MGLRLVVLTVLLAGCGGRTVSWSDGGDDGAVQPADGPPVVFEIAVSPDQAPPLRDAAGCGGPERPMGLVSTFFDGAPKTVLTDAVSGEIDYHGPVTQPLASSPLFDREIRIQGKVIQYYLPPALKLPLTVGKGVLYSVIMKRRFIPNASFTEALIIKGNTPGPWPFVLIAEPATYGQALDPDDPSISPLQVKLLESTTCLSPSSRCAPQYVDRLRFEATTGAGINVTELEQGEIISHTLFGQKMQIANLASWHRRPPCPDGPETRMSYLLVAE